MPADTPPPGRIDPALLAEAIDYALSRPRPPSPAQIEREKQQCQVDPVYFISGYCQIYDNTTRRWIPFQLWEAQRTALKVVMAHKFVQAMKARQLGFTWLLGAAYPLWQMLFDPIAQILIFSQRDDEAQKLLERIKGMYALLPPWLKLDVKTDSAHEFGLVNGSGAQALPASAGGRSNAATYVLIDEADFVTDLDSLIAAAKPTVDAGHNKMVVISTVNDHTPNSYFQRLFRAATGGDSDWQALFIPWHERPARTRDWYEKEKANSFATFGTLDKFYKEYPETPEQALAPRELNKRFPPQWITLVTQSRASLPLPPDIPAVDGLFIYAYPQPGQRYGVGADPSGGVAGGDPAAICVVDADTFQQVAVWAGLLTPAPFGDLVADVALYYNNAPVLFELNNHGHATRQRLRERDVTLRMGMTKHGPSGSPGWLTVRWSKELMYDIAVKVVQQVVQTAQETSAPALPLIHDTLTALELASIDIEELTAPAGFHDDRATAWALAQVCVYRGVASMTQQAHRGLWNRRESRERRGAVAQVTQHTPPRPNIPTPPLPPVAAPVPMRETLEDIIRRVRFRR